MDDATSIERADMTPVMEKMDPNFPSVSPNFCLKKNVTHDLEKDSTLANTPPFERMSHARMDGINLQRRQP